MRSSSSIGKSCVSRIAAVIVSAFAVAAVIGSPVWASPSPVADGTAGVEGTVRTVLQVGDRTFIAGVFTSVGGQERLNAAAILADGTVDPLWNPSPDGEVRTLAASADGSRIFLGGYFLNAGGARRSRLAAVDASAGSAITDWVVNANAEVRGLATSGSTLYVGGTFTRIDGLIIKRLAAVDMTTGAVNTAFQPLPSAKVRALAVSPDGTKVYAGGDFGSIGGASRPGAAELNADNGQATDFAPTDGGVVLAVALTPDGSRFFFSSTSNRLRAYDPAVSNSPVYSIHTSGDTQAIAASATEVYFGGHFSDLVTYKVKRLHLASVYVTSGLATTWDPRVDGKLGVWGIVLTPSSVIIGGDFKTVGYVPQPGFARFSGTP